MKGFRKKFTFPALCLAVGLVVFGVSYTMLGQGPGSGPGESDTTEPVGNTGANPGGGGPGGGDTGGGGDPPTSPPEELRPENDEPGPVGVTSELKRVVTSGDVLALRQLLEDGADPNATDEGGNAALHWAIMSSRISSVVFSQVRELLTHGATPGLANGQGLSPLHYAAMFGGTDATASALIDAGGVVNVVSEQQVGSPYELALQLGNDGVASAIERAPGHVALEPERESFLRSFGDYSKALRGGFSKAKTDNEVEGAVTNAVSRLVTAGVIDEAKAETVKAQLLKRIRNHKCTTCEGE